MRAIGPKKVQPAAQTREKGVERPFRVSFVSATTTSQNGRSVSRQTVRSEGDVDSAVTGPNGQTVTRKVERSPEATEAVVTLPNGQTVVRETTRQP